MKTSSTSGFMKNLREAKPWLDGLLIRALAAALLFAAAGAVARFMNLDLSGLLKSERAAYEFENMHIRVWHENNVQWEIRAAHVLVYPEKDEYVITNIYRGTFARGEKTYYFTAQGGLYNSRTKYLEIHGPVAFITNDGDSFKTTDVYWRGDSKSLRMPNRVEVAEEGNTFAGDALEAVGGKLEQVTLTGNVGVRVPDAQKANKGRAARDLKEAKISRTDVVDFSLDGERVEYARGTGVIKCFASRAGLPGFATGTPLLPQAPGAPGAPHGLPPPIRMPNAGELRAMDTAAARTVERAAVLATRGIRVEGLEIFVDTKNKYARASGKVRVLRRGRYAKSDDHKIARALQRRDTTIVTEMVNYFWRDGRLQIDTPLSVMQRDLSMSANSALALLKEDKLQLRGNVRLYQADGRWLFDEKIIEDDATEKTREVAREETTLTCGNLDADMQSEDITVTGGMQILQKERLLRAATAVYRGATKTWQVYGGVEITDKDNKYTGPMFEYNEDTGELTAPAGAYMEILPDSDQRVRIADYYKERDGDGFKPESVDRDKILVRGNHVYYNEERDEITLTGDAELLYRDVAVNSDRAVINNDAETMRADGRVHIRDKSTDIEADKFEGDFDKDGYTVTGGVRVDYRGGERNGKKADAFKLRCERLDYNEKTRRGKATGSPVLTTRERRAEADVIEFDARDNVYTLDGHVRLHQDNGDWLRGKDYIDADDKQAWYLADKPTDVSCRHARFETDRDYFVLTGAVNIEQKEKTAHADTVEFFGKEKRLVLDGDVAVSQRSGEWLFEGEFLDKDEDEDVRDRARGRVDIYAQRIESLYGDEIMKLTGGVTMKQGKSKATGDTVWYYGKDKLTVIEGNVTFIDEDGSRINAKRVVYNGKTKSLEAFESVTGSGYSDRTRKK